MIPLLPIGDAAASDLTNRSLVFLGEWDVWIQVAVGLVALAVVGLTAWNYRAMKPRRRAGLLALRVLVVAALMAVFYQPALLEESVARSRSHIAVLLDLSGSMDLPHGELDEAGERPTRLALARRFIRDNGALWDRMEAQGELEFFAFGEELRELPPLHREPQALANVSTEARQTRIVGSLDALSSRLRNRDLGGAVLITDGIDTTSHGRRSALDAATEQLLAELDAPVSALTTAGDGELKDIAVVDAAAGSFAFLMNATSLEATVRVHGYPYGQIEARLLENGRVIAREAITINPTQRDYPVSFAFVPKKLGKQVYRVDVDTLADEVYANNNHREMIVNVLRDKIRVLQIVGQPSWDERFLRNHLKQNPNVDLISFFILVNTTSMVRPVSAAETALIPFPAQELFEEELGGFDLVIFQNFNYGPFRTRQYLPLIADYVREGGAFVMVGGPLSFSAGGYYGTPIVDVLPVEIPQSFAGGYDPFGGAATQVRDDTLDTEVFRARLTESGSLHPVTRLALDPARNAALWADLSELEGLNKITRLRSDALSLVEHPSLKTSDRRPMPLVAVREVGKGRSMAVLTDSTWHWSFPAGNAGKDPRLYDAFWSNAVRWLIKDPELDLVRVRLTRAEVPVGETAKARIEVFRPDYRPAAEEPIDVVVRRRSSAEATGGGDVVMKLDGRKTDGAGVVELDVPVDAVGVYEVEARAHVVTERVAEGRDLFIGTDRNPEFDDVVGDGTLLKNLAKASGGEVFPLTASDPAIPLREPRVSRVTHRRHVELWNVPVVLLILTLLLGAEWWLRRRYGYL